MKQRDKTLKARHCANGTTLRSYITKEKASSYTVSIDSVLITRVIDAKQKRYVITFEIPNLFVQAKITKDKVRIIMKS